MSQREVRMYCAKYILGTLVPNMERDLCDFMAIMANRFLYIIIIIIIIIMPLSGRIFEEKIYG